MGRKPEPTDLSTRFVLATLGSENRWKRVASYAALGLVVAGVAGYFIMKNVTASVAAALEQDWGALQGCTLGDPLAAGETPSARVRGIQLTVVGIAHDARGKPGQLGWPSDCATLAAALAEHAASADTGAAELKAAAGALAKAMHEDANALADIGKPVEDVWQAAAHAQLKSGPTNASATPKPMAPLYTKEGFDRPSGLKGEITLSSLRLDPSPGSELRFLVDDKGLEGGPAVCSIDGVKPALACAHLSAEVARLTPGLSLFGTTDEGAPAWIFAGDRGQLGIFRPEGKVALSGATAYGAAAHEDGSLALLIHQGSGNPLDLKLAYVPAAGDPAEHDALSESDVDVGSDATLAYDWLVYRSGTKAKPATHLLARKLGAKAEPGAVVDVGDVGNLERPNRDDKQPTFMACRAGETTVVRLHGGKTDGVSFNAGGVWSAPVSLQMRGGLMTCHANEAIVTRVTTGPDASVDQARCNSTGCQIEKLGMHDLLSGTDVVPTEGGTLGAGDVAGKLLVVWNAGAVGGVRMRFASADRMKAAPDTLIVDPREDSGMTTATDVRVVSGSDFALVFVNTTRGVKVFRADSTGKLTPLQTQL